MPGREKVEMENDWKWGRMERNGGGADGRRGGSSSGRGKEEKRRKKGKKKESDGRITRDTMKTRRGKGEIQIVWERGKAWMARG